MPSAIAAPSSTKNHFSSSAFTCLLCIIIICVVLLSQTLDHLPVIRSPLHWTRLAFGMLFTSFVFEEILLCWLAQWYVVGFFRLVSQVIFLQSFIADGFFQLFSQNIDAIFVAASVNEQ
jgi:hypothetical protein